MEDQIKEELLRRVFEIVRDDSKSAIQKATDLYIIAVFANELIEQLRKVQQ